ncbi:hypothetical protein E2C01_021679 [Portunus trituberculatus]|uniref:Uncharacterized protein n=1 Tax=Portunus trituberculatus TaxID=210409 RepID=A0A5B7E5C4_PORTR|nr:hypothetical protein [Portunus trituberculatus]
MKLSPYRFEHNNSEHTTRYRSHTITTITSDGHLTPSRASTATATAIPPPAPSLSRCLRQSPSTRSHRDCDSRPGYSHGT